MLNKKFGKCLGSLDKVWGRFSMIFLTSLHPLPKSLALLQSPPFRLGDTDMAIELKPGGSVRVTISKAITRDSARKTIERLFMKDKAVRSPLDARSRNFIELPKRRGGQIWTKRPNKLHPLLEKGASATVKTTPQSIKDLKSVEGFVEVVSA
jgi:hypothetical protein